MPAKLDLSSIGISEPTKITFGFDSNIDLTGYTLIIPSVGIGNVGQLCADLLINTLNMEKLGSLWDAALIPIHGGSAYDNADIEPTTACELFISKAHKIAVVHIHSPIVRNLMTKFFGNILEVFAARGCIRLIILTSSFATEMTSVKASPFEFIANELWKTKGLKVIDLKEHTGSLIHGGGFAMELMEVASRLQMPTLILFKYSSEGDNSPDAMQLLEVFNNWAKVIPDGVAVKWPLSWTSLFGNGPTHQLY